MRLDTSGNLGLGVTPSAWSLSGGNSLTIKGLTIGAQSNQGFITNNGYFNGANWIYTTSSIAAQYYQDNAGKHQWLTAPSGTAGNTISFTQAMTLDASGNLALGETSAQGFRLNLKVSGSGTTRLDNDVLRLASNGSGADVNMNFTDGVTYNAYIGMVGGNLYFDTGATERMRIDSSGRLLIATTSNPDVGQVVIAFVPGSTQGLVFKQSINTSDPTPIMFFNATNSVVGSVLTSATTTTYNTSSDYRLKENVAPMTGALAKVAALNPVTYTWKEDGSNGQGFIAHELQAVVPDCVSGQKDAVDKDGKPKYQGVDTSFLVATLTAAIQEQQALIQDLTTRLTALEGN
jgi:hypothetical protein